MPPKITLYSTENCVYCVKAKELFNKIGRAFEEVRFEDNPVAFQAIADRVGAMSVPIITIGESVIVGYSPNKILEAL